VQNSVLSDKIRKILEGGEVEKLQVKRAETKKDKRKFIFYPWHIYKDDPNWVPPLLGDFREKIDKQKNPFFEHADMDLFLCYQDGRIVGRIAAIIDENHNTIHGEKAVFFGLYESENNVEAAKALLETVVEWGKEKGMEILKGPMNLSMNDECAFLLEGFDSPPAVMMTYNPPYYLELMEKCGLVKAKDLLAFYMEKDHQEAEKVRMIVDKVSREIPVTLRTVDMKNLKEEVEKIRYIYNNAWSENWGFVPWTENEFYHIAKKLKQVADPELVILAEDKGKPVGFAFGLPNLNEAIKKINGKLTPWGILKFMYYRKKIQGMRGFVFGVLKEYRQSGLSYLLYSELEKNGQKQGYKWCETSWQLEDNDAINRFVASLGGRVYKKYRIFEKKIVDDSC
jgi:GNAT superfamily N-acetyltransferase